MLEHCFGDLLPSAARALVSSVSDVGRLGLARSRRSNSSQSCSMGLRLGLCAGQTSSYTLISTPFLYGPRFVHGGLAMLKQERAFHKVGSTKSSRIAVALRFPFTGTKEPSPNHSWHYAFGQVVFSWHLPKPD